MYLTQGLGRYSCLLEDTLYQISPGVPEMGVKMHNFHSLQNALQSSAGTHIYSSLCFSKIQFKTNFPLEYFFAVCCHFRTQIIRHNLLPLQVWIIFLCV